MGKGCSDWDCGIAHSNFKVDKLLGERAHLVVEAKAIFANLVGRENEVALSFFGTVKDDFLRSTI